MNNVILVGLGNPGPRYEKTRHNAGFLFLDLLARQKGLDFRKPLLKPWLQAQDQSITLVKPLTWMNNSGEIFRHAQLGFGPETEILVAVDTMDLPAGSLRLKKKAGTAGHNGLKSMISVIGERFCPLYIGVGRPRPGETVIDHVLGDFSPEEEDLVGQALAHASAVLPVLLEQGMDEAMNRMNSFKALPRVCGPES